jgi:hypothetical protein
LFFSVVSLALGFKLLASNDYDGAMFILPSPASSAFSTLENGNPVSWLGCCGVTDCIN